MLGNECLKHQMRVALWLYQEHLNRRHPLNETSCVRGQVQVYFLVEYVSSVTCVYRTSVNSKFQRRSFDQSWNLHAPSSLYDMLTFSGTSPPCSKITMLCSVCFRFFKYWSTEWNTIDADLSPNSFPVETLHFLISALGLLRTTTDARPTASVLSRLT